MGVFAQRLDDWHQRAVEEDRRVLAAVTGFLQTAGEVWEHLVVDSGLQAAAGLAYTSILSMVPLLAVSFALFKAIVPDEQLATTVRDWMLGSLLADSVTEVGPVLESFLERAQGGAVGLVGFVFLLITSLSLFLSVERAINHIWRAPVSRPLHRRLTAFYAVITLGPALAGIGALAAHWMRSGLQIVPFGVQLGATVLPWILETAALFLLYKLLPHAQVRMKFAAIGAVAAAIVFNLGKWAFNYYIVAIYAGSTSAKIYGSFALIPVFFLWIYLSWLIVLGGAELCYLVQNRHVLSREVLRRRGGLVQAAPTGYLVARAFGVIATHFRGHGGGTTAEQIAGRLQIPVTEVEPVLRLLVKGGLAMKVEAKGDDEFVPGRPLDRISLAELNALADAAGYQPGQLPAQDAQTLESALAAGRSTLDEALSESIAAAIEPPTPR